MKIGIGNKDARRDAAPLPISHALDGPGRANKAKHFGDFFRPAEKIDDMSFCFHAGIKHCVYKIVNAACNL